MDSDQAPDEVHRAERFALPKGKTYLCGNSLGPLPQGVAEAVAEAVTRQWGDGLVASWNDAGWSSLSSEVAAALAPLMGVAPDDLVVGDTTSVAVFKALTAAASLRPGRSTIVMEEQTFPTDAYVATGVVDSLGLKLIFFDAADPTALSAALEDAEGQVAVVAVTEVDFRTGRRHDLAHVAEQAHHAGALFLADLCHSTGALDIALVESRVDLAVGCTYKYLNGGPGSPAYLWVAPEHSNQIDPTLRGWWGHAAPFDFELSWSSAAGARRWQVGTPPILALAALKAALKVYEGVNPASLRSASLHLTESFMAAIEAKAPEVEIVTPRRPEERGSQVSFRHEAAYGIIQALASRGVIGDFRSPDIARFGVNALFNSVGDVERAADQLALVLAAGEHLAVQHTQRRPVT